MFENYQFGEKPDPGQNLSGKFFSVKFLEFNNKFNCLNILMIWKRYMHKI